MSPASQLVESTLSSNDIVVFSKSWCPYCRKTKALLGDSDFTSRFPEVTVKILDVDLMDEGDDIHHAAKEKTVGNGRDRVHTSVPAVFVKQQFLGGNDDLQAAWKNGTLTKLLTA